jgi:hypothetical protein
VAEKTDKYYQVTTPVLNPAQWASYKLHYKYDEEQGGADDYFLHPTATRYS